MPTRLVQRGGQVKQGLANFRAGVLHTSGRPGLRHGGIRLPPEKHRRIRGPVGLLIDRFHHHLLVACKSQHLTRAQKIVACTD